MDIDKLFEDTAKVYYTISEVADIFDVSPSLLRYWESEFSNLRPIKNSKGDRRFTRNNLEQLQMIYHLVKERGFTLEGAKNELKQNKKRIQTISKIHSKLLNLKRSMEDLRNKL